MSRRRRSRAAAVIATVLGAAAWTVACGGSDGDEGGRIEIEGALVGETPAGGDAAVYFEIRSTSADALVGASSPASAEAALHTIDPVEGGGIMFETDRIEVVAGEVTRLAPLGTHVMLIDLREDLVEGDTVMLVLEFADHPDVDVVVEVVPLIELAELLPEE